MSSGDTGWTLSRNAPLIDLNTFHVAATAPWLLQVSDPATLPTALERAHVDDQPLLVLGSGSNMLLAGDPEGGVLSFANRDITILEHRSDHAIIRAGAGTLWHALVVWSLANGLSGLENLALIPGTVGAAPIQNIGAYGAQAGDFISTVEAWDRQTNAFIRIPAAECAFAYRDSRFKHEPGRYLIVAVEFRLPLLHELRLDYAGIREELSARGIETPQASDVAHAVIAIRSRKLPDPATLGNAGSFFKNPQIPQAQIDALRAQHPQLPVFPSDNPHLGKVSAAWLIEQAGWKGRRQGDAGIFERHALVLVNHGRASGADLLGLAREVAASVDNRFGVSIEPEPLLIGAHW